FGDRRAFAAARLPDGVMILPASPLRFKNGDSEYRYRPDSELYYLTGWDAPEAVAVLSGTGGGPHFSLFIRAPDPAKELWTGPRLSLEEARERTGADEVWPLSTLDEKAPPLLAKSDRIFYRLGSHVECDRLVRSALADGRSQRFRSGTGPHVLADPGAILDRMRTRKDESEIARIRRAALITVESFRAALGAVAPGVGEWELEARLDSGFREAGADGPAFATIVGAGLHGCTLHYVDNGGRAAEEDLILMDAGAELEYYAADVTRTVPASGRWEGARAEVYSAVLEAQRAVLSGARPGADLEGLHEVAARMLAESLLGLGALSGTLDEVLEAGAYRAYFPHRTSHWLGLDTHDPGYYRTTEGAVALEQGMVFTVEPGLYFPPGSCPGRADLEGIGVRIEDDVLITDEGADVLTASLPTDPAELTALMAEGS
ncbi:MAG: M24 family metallopeptidase, partial [Gemmatimonadetes bacterium]|nr:M24 family metallopeptidase [Gemmatimonadota bacterium]